MLTQNTKFKNTGIFGFGITPGITCVGCKIKCYAMRGNYNTFAKNMCNHWDANLMRTKQVDFTAAMFYSIKDNKKCTHVRIHTEGDFYSQEYLNKWIHIANLLPHIQFYAYTKALHLDWSSLPSNFKRIQSVGGEYDHLIDYSKPHARVFKTEDELFAAGYWNCTKDDELAANPASIEIGLIEH